MEGKPRIFLPALICWGPCMSSVMDEIALDEGSIAYGRFTGSVLAELQGAVGVNGVVIERNQLQTYECDGLTALRTMPLAVVLPRSTAEVQAVVRVCATHRIPFVARGAGTGLSGGALPAGNGVVIGFARMTQILAVDLPNQRITVQPGVINAHVTQRVSAAGYFYAPDPSSQSVCTIGGNLAENAGGAHCLKYGFTTTHTLGMEVVLPTWGTGASRVGDGGCAGV